MDFALFVAFGVTAVVLLGLFIALVLARRRVSHQLLETRADLEALRTRLDEMSATGGGSDPTRLTEYVITSAGTSPVPEDRTVTVSDRMVLSAAFGEPVVKLVAFGYGVRRALSAENRNRIRFEMRREVKRARKQRLRGRRNSDTTTRDAA